MRIVFTGGHHNSSLEVLKLIRELKPDAQFLWLGHRHTSLKDKSDSAEYREVTSADIKFIELKAGKFYKVFNPVHLLRIPYGFIQAFYHLFKFKPDVIVSFGGYLAVPVVIAGKLLGIKSVTHEQTSVVGLANRIIGKYADKVFITWPQSQVYFDKEKTVLTGLPIRGSIFKHDSDYFKFNNDLPIIYITGGKQGSHIINSVIAEKLEELLKITNIIHQTGANTETKDNEILKEKKDNLPEDLKDRYILKDFVYESEIGSVFAASDIIISRAGAHIIYEILAVGKPSLLVPIPWSSHNEQLMNAKMVVGMGLGKLLEQEDLTAASLYEAVEDMLKNIDEYKKNAEKAKEKIILDAADKIAKEIVELAASN